MDARWPVCGSYGYLWSGDLLPSLFSMISSRHATQRGASARPLDRRALIFRVGFAICLVDRASSKIVFPEARCRQRRALFYVASHLSTTPPTLGTGLECALAQKLAERRDVQEGASCRNTKPAACGAGSCAARYGSDGMCGCSAASGKGKVSRLERSSWGEPFTGQKNTPGTPAGATGVLGVAQAVSVPLALIRSKPQ